MIIHPTQRTRSFTLVELLVVIAIIGISAHEGQLFGAANQLLVLITALGLIVLACSGYNLWRRRRVPGSLGAPAPGESPRASIGLITIISVMAICMPLFGATLILVLALERRILSRIPSLRNWLGLFAPPTTG